jgi:methionyl-tRNA synthetase
MTDRYLVTSALPYVNGIKHLGNLAGSLLPADVHARFRRQTGARVLFLCGTDEHGTPAEISAAEAGVPVAEYCADFHARQEASYRALGISFDHFGRTSSAANHALTQHFYRRLDAEGFISEREVPQVWSPRDGRFLPDRYVLGRCPRCGDPDARGDQCDACGALLDPVDLGEPRSALSGDTDLEVRSSRHLFLRQDLLRERLREWLGTRTGWPSFVTSLARSWLTDDLRERCITRDLSWGVPVPRPGFEGKVFYVWFDAPIGYLALAREWAEADPARGDWLDWWTEGRGVRYLQFLGKDNVPFHTVGFPATLLGSGEPWKTADSVKGFHWLTYGQGGKFSTSRRRGVFCDEAADALPADFWRWWLVANAPETSDVDLDLRRLAADVNKDLADVFGNLANRLVSLAWRRYGGVVPDGGVPGPREAALAEAVGRRLDAIREAHEACEFRRAAAGTRALWDLANAYVQDSRPWQADPADPDGAACALRTGLALVRIGALAAWSVVPSLSGDALRLLGLPVAEVPEWPAADLLDGRDHAGATLGPAVPLVAKVTPEAVEALVVRFAGRPDGRADGARPDAAAP